MTMRSGIYVIQNTVNGKFYIGSGVDCQRRWEHHVWALRCRRHGNKHLQRAWDKYGGGAFKFEQIAALDRNDVRACEQRLLDRLVGRSGCYNAARKAAGGNGGGRRSEAARANIAAAARRRVWAEQMRQRARELAVGRRHSNETKARLAEISRRRPPVLDEATRERIRAKLIGRKLSPEHVEKVRASLRGRCVSDATRAKLSAQRVGKPLSAEHRARCREGWQEKLGSGWTVSDERRAQISERQRGSKHSPETRARMSAAAAHRRRDPATGAFLPRGD